MTVNKSTVWLDNSRIIAMFAVVMLHVATIVMVSNEIGSTYWWFGNIYNSLVRWCVPVFVMISGALLLSPHKQEDILTFYQKRAAKLLIPITTWSLIFLTWRFIKGIAKGEPPTILELLEKLVSGNPYEHMWFLYMILGLYLFTPFFRKIIQHSTNKEVNLLIIATFSLATINHIYTSFIPSGSQLFINWFFLYIPFFFLGHRIRNTEFQPPQFILWSTFLTSSTLTAIGCSVLAIKNGLPFSTYFYGYLSLTVIPMAISMMYLLKSWNNPISNNNVTKTLSLLTLGIYLIHPIILEIMGYTGYTTNIHPIISIPIVTGIIFIISLTGAWILYKIPFFKRTI